jgi:hypothetical protein
MSHSLNLISTSADGLWHDEEEIGEWGIPISTSNAKGFHFDNAKLSRRMLLPIFFLYIIIPNCLLLFRIALIFSSYFKVQHKRFRHSQRGEASNTHETETPQRCW